ncbi:MAG: hypothetical protein ACREIF_10775 [Chthoniobacterales bacterium]
MQSQIQDFKDMAYLLEALSAVVFVIGLVAAFAQPVDFSWKKLVIGVLGFVSALIVGLNHLFFPAEYRAYNKVADEARLKVNAFSRQLALYTTLDDATKAQLRQQFATLQNEIDQLEFKAIENAAPAGAPTASARGFSILPEAWAQEPRTTTTVAAPEWARAVPVDRNLYYLWGGRRKDLRGSAGGGDRQRA